MEITFTIFADDTPFVLINYSVDMFSRTQSDLRPTEHINPVTSLVKTFNL